MSSGAGIETPAGLPPGSTLPRSRQTARWLIRPVEFLRSLQERHGDVFTVHLHQEPPWVMVSDPSLVEQIYQASPDVLHAGAPKWALQPFLGPDSLLTSDGERHMRQRKLLLPSFHRSRLAGYEATMREVAAAEIERWPVGSAAPVVPLMSAIALEVILRAVFGVGDNGGSSGLRGAFTRLMGHLFDSGRTSLVALGESARLNEDRFAALRRCIAGTDELVQAEVARRRGEGPAGRDDVLSMLLAARHEDGSPLSDLELRDQLITLVAAGYDTTAVSLAWAIERLARNPEALALVAAEAGYGGGSYTDAAIQETLRLRPVFPVTPRLATQPFELGDLKIPRGVVVTPSIPLVHRRAEVYREPDAFRPARFLERSPGTYTWIPFGGGVRRCVGSGFAMLEMRVVLATLLARLTVRPAGEKAESSARRGWVVAPARGANLVLEPR